MIVSEGIIHLNLLHISPRRTDILASNFGCLNAHSYSSQFNVSYVFGFLFRVRFHYGHPDVFDRLFHLTRGGVSKASKVINLSEDIFAGMFLIIKALCFVFKQVIWFKHISHSCVCDYEFQVSTPPCVKAMLLIMNTYKLVKGGMSALTRSLCLRLR